MQKERQTLDSGSAILVGMDPVPGRRMQEAFAKEGWDCRTAESTFEAAYKLVESGTRQHVAILMDVDNLGVQSCIDIARTVGGHRTFQRALLIGIHRAIPDKPFDTTIFDHVYRIPFDPHLCALQLKSLQPDNMWDSPPPANEGEYN